VADATLQISGLDELEKALKKAPTATVKVLLGAMQEATVVAQREIVERTPVAWGNLAGSINRQVRASSSGVEGIVGTNVPYALWVEEDTKHHWPPLEPILAWVQKKKIAGVYSIKTQRRLGGKATRVAQDRQMAYMIARKIARDGTTGQHMFRDGLQAATPEIRRIFDEAIQDIVAVLGRE
jgi:hypothetical protein